MTMKIKALWGFVGDTGHVHRGDVVEVSKEYGHSLIGKGLAKEVTGKSDAGGKKADEGAQQGKTEPKATKPAAPTETK